MASDKVLVVDDEMAMCKALSEFFTNFGYEVATAHDGAAAIEMAKKSAYSVAIVDLVMPGMSGMETVRLLKEIDPDIEVILFTGYPSLESSLDAIRQQVFDYICKPTDMEILQRVVQHAAERRRLIIENRELLRQLKIERDHLKQEVTVVKRVIERRIEESCSLVGKSEAIRKIRHFVAQVAPSDITVLIQGETGTGKDLVARLIHESSGRDPNSFVKINCPAIPETLLESELFGYESGAFTGAVKRKLGRFELASGGMIFLDEIGELPMTIQGKLLQAIEHKEFVRLGSGETIRVDVRIVAATNAEIEKMVAQGRFRPDIFYRLNEYSIKVPPLRRRSEDIPLLAQHFLNLYGNMYGRPDLKISSETMAILVLHRWPGNVRELESVIRRFTLDGDEDSVRQSLESSRGRDDSSTVAGTLRDTEIRTIFSVLAKTRWNQCKAAQILGISYSSLRRRIAKYDLKNR